jgi:hypothetical protein
MEAILHLRLARLDVLAGVRDSPTLTATQKLTHCLTSPAVHWTAERKLDCECEKAA